MLLIGSWSCSRNKLCFGGVVDITMVILMLRYSLVWPPTHPDSFSWSWMSFSSRCSLSVRKVLASSYYLIVGWKTLEPDSAENCIFAIFLKFSHISLNLSNASQQITKTNSTFPRQIPKTSKTWPQAFPSKRQTSLEKCQHIRLWIPCTNRKFIGSQQKHIGRYSLCGK